MSSYPWEAEAIILAVPPIGGPDLSKFATRNITLEAAIRTAMALPPGFQKGLQIEYGQGNPSMDMAAIKAAYALPDFPGMWKPKKRRP